MAEKSSVLVITDGGIRHASTRIRAVNVFQQIEKKYGISWQWISRVSPVGRKTLYDRIRFAIGKRVRWLLRHLVLFFFSGNKTIFCQRICLDSMELFFIRRNSGRLIFDFDDALYLDYRKNGKEYRFTRMLKNAAEVIVSTEELRQYCLDLGIEARIIPSSVDTELIRPAVKKQINSINIGWIGSPVTTRYLDDISPVLLRILELGSFELHFMGAVRRDWMNHPEVVLHDWTPEREIEFLKSIDIGIMPLSDDEWSRGKGGYKLLLYMAAGLPCVASPVGINGRIVINEMNGILAATNDEWLSAIECLAKDSEMRNRLGRNGRNMAVRDFSLKRSSDRIVELLKKK
ncbi:MAG: glycosyltransferase family 4 protein [Crocinitomicaceae bacterium]|nr:glycosyltransferase family 4 protein [Crocinitomicaceae bacterium]